MKTAAAAPPRNGADIERRLNRALLAEQPPAQPLPSKVVILGGGTGLSTVVGGDTRATGWERLGPTGLKAEFSDLHMIVCTTDDGGSTGSLLRHWPLPALGDLRKVLLSSAQADRLVAVHGCPAEQARILLPRLARLVNHRFCPGARLSQLAAPPRLLPPAERSGWPPGLLADLARWSGRAAGLLRAADEPLAGHCLGNLLLLGALAEAAGGDLSRPPAIKTVQRALYTVARAWGAPAGRVHPACITPGQLILRYANGVQVVGQAKAGQSRRGQPIATINAAFADAPRVPAAALRALERADVIVLAPGSLYTSMLALLQLEPIAAAIRANRRALKILGANFWMQQGETDISPRNAARGFLVSELIEAYDRNVPGGAGGLFDVILTSNLEQMPGDILRRYALEGKRPIHLDRRRVRALGYCPVEAPLFSLPRRGQRAMVHHDPRAFGAAVGILVTAAQTGWTPRAGHASTRRSRARPGLTLTRAPACAQFAAVRARLRAMTFRPTGLRRELEALCWLNRDIQPGHLAWCERVLRVPARQWGRSREWDNVLGYYDPDRRAILLHAEMAADPDRQRESLLVGLGESLLGNYIATRHEPTTAGLEAYGLACYEFTLRPEAERHGFFAARALRRFLRLAGMQPDPRQPRVFRQCFPRAEGFLPPGLLCGLLFAWYLDNRYGGTMEYEMSLLRWPTTQLLPHASRDRARKVALIRFFRETVFGHP